jgi:hypothetical protein
MREPWLLRSTRLCSMALGVGAFFLGIPQPMAAEAPSTASESSQAETRVDEAKLDAFARSYVRLAEVRKEHAGDLGIAGEPKAEAAEDTIEVLRDEGLSAHEYNRILDAVNADPELRSLALRKIESHR